MKTLRLMCLLLSVGLAMLLTPMTIGQNSVILPGDNCVPGICSAPTPANPDCKIDVTTCNATYVGISSVVYQPWTVIATGGNTGRNCNNALSHLDVSAGAGYTKSHSISFGFSVNVSGPFKQVLEVEVGASLGFEFGTAITFAADCTLEVDPCSEGRVEQVLLRRHGTVSVQYSHTIEGTWETKWSLLGGPCPLAGTHFGPYPCGGIQTVMANVQIFDGECQVPFHQHCASSSNPACSAINPNVIIVPPCPLPGGNP